MQIIETLGIIFLIVTSHGQMENGKATGLWLEEFAVPYEIFVDAGYTVYVLSPEGGEAPIDPRSLPETPTEQEQKAIEQLKHTLALKDYHGVPPDALFFAGGHGTMFDFPTDPTVQEWIKGALAQELPLALVCHGPAALVGATNAEGESFIKGKKVTGFSNAEEEAVNLTEEMPFLLETKLKELGATYSSAENFTPYVVVDGFLITGQNPPSSAAVATELIRLLK
ncbi:type 1 glutamine amidotransferase domain-containing protein [Kiritimatiellota bacterium B12222]|nr:type 1 glutamine amidotransferase domain-containing protein [Kiritimatiellota bacterium B12222]